MKKHNILVVFLFFIAFNSNLLFAQVENSEPSESKDKPKSKKERRFYFLEDNFLYKGSPSIEISYGESNPSLKNYHSNINGAGILELKLGWHKEKNTFSKSIVKYKNNFLHGSYTSEDIKASNPNSSDATLRFGFGTSKGYGYKLKTNASIILFNSNSFSWTRYDNGISAYTMEFADHFDKLDDFNGTFRFGSTTEGGVIIPLSGLINLQASYDRTIVFPRHLVWKHLGSLLVESGGQMLLDGFVREIFHSLPAAAPIVSFLLKNGLSYGLYELRREKMNWPFNSAEPLLFDSYKAGLTFTF